MEIINKQQNKIKDLTTERIPWSYTKRVSLVYRIRHIYHMAKRPTPIPPNSITSNKFQIYHVLNNIMREPRLTQREAAMRNIKRRLFFGEKKSERKIRQPKRRTMQWTEIDFHKYTRPLDITMRIRRNYLKCEQIPKRNPINEEILMATSSSLDENIKNFQQTEAITNWCGHHNNMTYKDSLKNAESPSSIEQSEGEELDREVYQAYQTKKLQEVLIRKQYQERTVATEKLLTASVRSILYLEVLLLSPIHTCKCRTDKIQLIELCIAGIIQHLLTFIPISEVKGNLMYSTKIKTQLSTKSKLDKTMQSIAVANAAACFCIVVYIFIVFKSKSLPIITAKIVAKAWSGKQQIERKKTEQK
uniref:Uncharacterized protein n=1 Tax=Glossina brevipalpis TaxID=37001 RepID=A0A1A9X0T0_9MUSC